MAEVLATLSAKPKGLSFGELLDWHLLSGTRPRGSSEQGRAWGKAVFAGKIGIGDRQLRNWLKNEKLPAEIETIELVLFGADQSYAREWRLELREAYRRAKFGVAPGDGAVAAEGAGDKPITASNIPIRVPEHFLGRDDALAAIDAALKRHAGRVAITALHGLRGVGKTTLAAAYAERHRADYRATWWIRAQTESTTRADLAALGVRLGWVAADEKEEPALAAVRERLRHEGEGLLLIYDNAIDAESLKSYLPPVGAARVLVTSNARVWRGIAAPVEIAVWPKAIGADYLIARTGRDKERADAEALSEALGGLPLAHEQAAAYCERLEVSFAEYRKRFDAAPARLLDDAKHAPAEYNDGLTVAKTFALAIEKAAKLHPAADPLIVHAALLAPEPIPLFLFTEGREKFGEPLASLLADDGLEEALAALRAFALIDRETIPDERVPTIVTESIRLHRLVREVAAGRCVGEAREEARRAWIEVMAGVYPVDVVFSNPSTWPRARRLDGLALGLVVGGLTASSEANAAVGHVMNALGQYRQSALAAYPEAQRLLERALAIREKSFGPEHPDTATGLNNLAVLLQARADLTGARPLFERALAIWEKTAGPEHYDTATTVSNLADLLRAQGDYAAARPLFERALAIREKAHGPEHPLTSKSLNKLANLLREQGDLAAARPLFERSLAILEKVAAFEHPETAATLNNLALLFQAQGDLAGARAHLERALAIYEVAFGPDHPQTAIILGNLALLLQALSDLAGARPLLERALAIREKALGREHPDTAISLNNLAMLFRAQGDLRAARPLLERAIEIGEKALAPDHPDGATRICNLAQVLRDGGNANEAEPLFRRAIAIGEKSLGHHHALTQRYVSHYARFLCDTERAAEALTLAQAALAVHEKALGAAHPWTQTSARVTADALDALGRSDEAAAMRARYGLGGAA